MNDITTIDPIASLDLGSIFDASLDSIEYAPDFVTPPAGDYILKATKLEAEEYDAKEKDEAGNLTGRVNKGKRLRLTLAIVSTLQLADAKEQPVPDGSMLSITYQLTSDGLSFFKTFARDALGVADLEGATLGAIKTALLDKEFNARVSIRKSPKKDAAGQVVVGEFYENASVRPMVAKS